MPDVPGPAVVEAHGRVLPHYLGRGAGEGVHRAVRGRVTSHLVSLGQKGEKRSKRNEEMGSK